MNLGDLGTKDFWCGLLGFLLVSDMWWALVVGGILWNVFMYVSYRILVFLINTCLSSLPWDHSLGRRSCQDTRANEQDWEPLSTSQQVSIQEGHLVPRLKVWSITMHSQKTMLLGGIIVRKAEVSSWQPAGLSEGHLGVSLPPGWLLNLCAPG